MTNLEKLRSAVFKSETNNYIKPSKIFISVKDYNDIVEELKRIYLVVMSDDEDFTKIFGLRVYRVIEDDVLEIC